MSSFYQFLFNVLIIINSYIFCRLNVVEWMANNILSLIINIMIHVCMHAEVGGAVVTAFFVWNVNQFLCWSLSVLQYLHAADLIGQP